MDRPYKTKGRILYLTETIAINILGGLTWLLSDYAPGMPVMGIIVAAAYYCFWIAKPRLMDISENQSLLQLDISGKSLGLWGFILWGYFFLVSGLSVYLCISLSEENNESVLSASSYLSLLTIAYAPAHLYLLFKPGYREEESGVTHYRDVPPLYAESADDIVSQPKYDLSVHSIEDKLQMLKDLYHKGLISTEEMAKKREEILKRI